MGTPGRLAPQPGCCAASAHLPCPSGFTAWPHVTTVIRVEIRVKGGDRQPRCGRRQNHLLFHEISCMVSMPFVCVRMGKWRPCSLKLKVRNIKCGDHFQESWCVYWEELVQRGHHRPVLGRVPHSQRVLVSLLIRGDQSGVVAYRVTLGANVWPLRVSASVLPSLLVCLGIRGAFFHIT